MGRALVVKNADFSANKVATITFDGVDCTGIALETDTITINGTEAVTVNYSVTPVNTTDAIEWSSSNESAFTVANGVITPVGIGSGTLTVTCGNFSDTATVTVTIPYNEKFAFSTIVTTNNHASTGVNYGRLAAFGNGTQAAQYGFVSSSATADYFPIKLPTGTSKVTITYDTTQASLLYNSTNTTIYWCSDAASPDASYSSYCTFLSKSEYNIRTVQTIEEDVPSGADSFAVMFRPQSTYTESDDPATIASTIGISISFS